MGRATEAGVEGADDRLDAVQHALFDLFPVDEVARHLIDTLVHRQAVVAGGDDQIGPLHHALAVDLVMVHQRAARRFADAEPFQPVGVGVGAHVVAQDVRLLQQPVDLLHAVEHLDQAGVVVLEGA